MMPIAAALYDIDCYAALRCYAVMLRMLTFIRERVIILLIFARQSSRSFSIHRALVTPMFAATIFIRVLMRPRLPPRFMFICTLLLFARAARDDARYATSAGATSCAILLF